jgi:hypothetical protein
MKLLFAFLMLVHGLIHLMGPAKAFGLAELPQLTHTISKATALLWPLAAALLVASAAALFVLPRWWWVGGALAVVVSQAAVNTSRADTPGPVNSLGS